MTDGGPDRYLQQWWCEDCKKIGYPTRWSAKAAKKRMHERGMRSYPCPARLRLGWHNGHTPVPVVRGDYTAAEWYGLHHKTRKRVLREYADAERAGDRPGDADGAGAAEAAPGAEPEPARGDLGDGPGGRVADPAGAVPGLAADDGVPAGDGA